MNEYDYLIINIQHMFFHYMMTMKNSPDEWKNKNYIEQPIYSNYLNRAEWNFILSKHGFQFINGNDIGDSTMKVTYDNQYFAFYKMIQ